MNKLDNIFEPCKVFKEKNFKKNAKKSKNKSVNNNMYNQCNLIGLIKKVDKYGKISVELYKNGQIKKN